MFWNRLKRRAGKAQRGQSLVEFSLTAIIIIMILSGLLDLGRLWFIYIALEDGAGEAALFLAINPTCETAADCPDPNNAEWRARHSAGGVLDWSTVDIITNVTVKAPGLPVEVTLEYPYRILTPLISQIAGQITLTAYASQTIVDISP